MKTVAQTVIEADHFYTIAAHTGNVIQAVEGVKDGGTRAGWMVGVDRDIGRTFRIGAGYNFTEFSDDLTDFDYDHKGWFVNFVGKY